MLHTLLLNSFTLPLLALGQGTASVYFANYNFPTLFTGQNFVLAWIGNGQPVNVSLAYGPLANLQKYQDITTNNIDKTFTWTVPADIPTDNYVFQIAQSNSSENRSPRFTISGTVIRGAVSNLTSSIAANFSGIVPTVLPKSTTIQTMAQAVATPGATAKAVPMLNGIPPMQIWVQDKAMQHNCEGLMPIPTAETVVIVTKTASITTYKSTFTASSKAGRTTTSSTSSAVATRSGGAGTKALRDTASSGVGSARWPATGLSLVSGLAVVFCVCIR